MRQYLYDATGRMTLGKNLENGTESAYTYNALRMCVKNTQTHPSADGFTNRETEYVPDFLSRTNNELMAYGTGAGATRTVFGHRYHRLYQNTPSGKAYFQSDIYGSPLFAADGQGAVEQYAERDIWGTLKPGTDILPGLEENMRFTTYRYDPVLGKHFALARFYDGANGRMMSKDPVKRGLNPYCYCDNDPVNYEDSTGEVLHILGAAGVGGLLGAGAAALDSIVSQALNGEKIDWKEVGGSAIDGGIIGAAQAGLLASGAGVPAALLVDFLAGTTGSAAKQYYVDGKIDVGESITRGLTNAVGQLPYNIKGIDKLKKLSDVGKEALKGGLAGAGEAGIRYITDHIGSNPAQVRMGTGLLPAIAGNFSPGELLRDPKRGCGSESPFTPGLGYSSARGYRYDVPRISESKSNKASLGGFLKETALGGLMGGLAGAAFYKLDKGLEKLKESVLPKSKESVFPKLGSNNPTGEKKADFYVKPSGEVVPSTGYRYSLRDITLIQNAKNGYIEAKSDGRYFSFDKIDDSIIAREKLQIPYRPEYRVSFDTLDIIDDISIPKGKWGTADYLEPITKDYRRFGPGGATQAVTYSRINSVKEIYKMR